MPRNAGIADWTLLQRGRRLRALMDSHSASSVLVIEHWIDAHRDVPPSLVKAIT
jgi:hypothetical protein